MNSAPAVSVIVPNYNHARFLPKRIESILAQSYQDFELILLDDASADNSRELLLEYGANPRVRFQFNDLNSGSTFKQWAKGVGLARGKYIWIAESDDYSDERFLEELLAALNTDPSVVFAYCRSWITDQDGRPGAFVDHWMRHSNPERWSEDFCTDGDEECRSYFVYNNVVGNASSVVFRKSVWDAVGGVDETLRTSADWRLWAAMAMRGKVAYVSKPLNYYRDHGNTVRRQADAVLIATERLQVIRWVLDHVTPPPAALDKARRDASAQWVPAVLSSRSAFAPKLKLVRSVLAVDPHPVRHALGPALTTVRLKLLRHWRELRMTISPSAN